MEAVIRFFKYKDLRNRALYILALLVVFRILACTPIPGVDLLKIRHFFEGNQFLGLLNLFSGGAMRNFSLAMLGVGPYITAIIIMQLLTLIFPRLKEMYYEEGEAGRAKFNRYCRYLTVPLAAIQGFGFLNFLRVQGIYQPESWFVILEDVILVVGGTIFLMWLGELITQKNLGNGISIIIFAGIVAGWPQRIRGAILSFSPEKTSIYLAFFIMALLVIAGIVIVNEAERRIPITYAKRVRGMRMYGGVSTYLPVKINQAGVIPIIFALAVVLFPQFLVQVLSGIDNVVAQKISEACLAFLRNNWLYGIVYFLLVFGFTYFYTLVTFDPKEIAQNLQRWGGFIPGIRPGPQTAEFLKKVIYRTTFVGGLFLGFVAVLPLITQSLTGSRILSIGGTSILIVVAVVIEIINQVKAELAMREY